MNKPTVYIAGPIRGREHYNWPAFEDACVMLEQEGYEVCSPHRIDENVDGFNPYKLPDDHDWWSWPESLPDIKTIIKRDILALLECEYIYLLDGWENSAGAQAEAAVARWAGLGFLGVDVPEIDRVPEDILHEAYALTSGDRQNQYGPPDQDFARTAKMWSALKGIDFAPWEVAAFMICLKLSRETHQNRRDNWTDLAGYARCGWICREVAK